MSPRITIFAVATTLSVIASGLALGAIHYAGLPAKTDHALFEFLMGIGLLAALFAVVPLWSGGAKFDRAADYSRLSLEIYVARPSMLRWGMVVFGFGQLGKGIEVLIAMLP
jgi:hypothetical protein